MIRKLKVFGLACVAVLAMAAVTASAASAIEFHSEGESTTITGKNNAGTQHLFTVAAGTIKCSSATFEATVTGKTVKTITATPAYAECALAGAAATVHMNGCTYTLLQPPTLTTGQVTIDCPVGKVIEVTAKECVVTVKAQGPLSSIEYKNIGSGTTREVEVNAAVTGVIHYVQDGVKCLGNGGLAEKTFTNGTFSGKTTATGEHIIEGVTTHTGIWVE